MSESVDRLLPICDLLLGAAYADDEFHEDEKKRIGELLRRLLAEPELPAALAANIDMFDPESFDLEASCKEFVNDAVVSKRKLMELVASVHDADEVHDLAEDDYMLALGGALGVSKEELADFTISYEIEELKGYLDEVRKTPPPLKKQ